MSVAESPMHILVAEDDAPLRQLLGEWLDGEGFEVELAACGTIVLERLATPPLPDFLLLDLSLPGVSGRGVIERLQSDKCPIPVALMTGYDREEVEKTLGELTSGLVGVIHKPPSMTLLGQTIRGLAAKPPGSVIYIPASRYG